MKIEINSENTCVLGVTLKRKRNRKILNPRGEFVYNLERVTMSPLLNKSPFRGCYPITITYIPDHSHGSHRDQKSIDVPGIPVMLQHNIQRILCVWNMSDSFFIEDEKSYC